MIDDDSYGEEENEETYVDPNDLIIIPKQSESMWEPTEGQIQAYALKLQMNPETDPPEVIDIAYKYLTEQLPEEWTRAFTKDRLELLYINLETNEIQLETDLEMAARQEYEEYMELIKEQNERDNAKVTVVPRKKIEPIGSKQNQKNEKENESTNKKSKSNKNKNKHNADKDKETKQDTNKSNNKKKKKNNNNNNNIDDDNIPSYKYNSYYNNEIFQPSNYKEQNDDNIKINNNDNSNSNNHHNNFSSDINININNNDDNEFSVSQGKYARNNKRHNKEVIENNDELIEKMKEIDKEEEAKASKNNKPKSQTKKDKKDNYINIEIEVNKQKYSVNTNNKHPSSSNDNNSNQKQQLQLDLNNKPTLTEEDEEISDNESNNVYSKDYSSQNKLKYLQQQKDEIDKNAENELRSFKQKLLEKVKAHKQKLITNHNKALETELNKIKKQYQTKTQGIISALKSEYKTKLQTEKEKIQKELSSSSNNNNNRNVNSKVTDLMEIKEQLQATINSKKKDKEREQLLKEQQKELTKQQQTINELIKLKKENIKSKYKLELTNIQNEHNTKIQNLQINYNNRLINSSNNQKTNSYNPNNDSKVKEILKEHQRNLDKIYENKKTEIEDELNHKMQNELEIFKNVILSENENKIKFYNNETKLLGNKFNSDLNDLQFTNIKTTFNTEQTLHNELNNVNRLFENISNKIDITLSNEIKQIINDLHNYIRKENNIQDTTNIEDQIEEYLIHLCSQRNIDLKSLKSVYDMKENEYKNAELQMKYFIEMLNVIKMNLLENTFNDYNNEFDNDDYETIMDDYNININNNNGVNSNNNNNTDEHLTQKLFKITKDKINEYKLKCKHNQNVSLYPCLSLSFKENNFFSNKEPSKTKQVYNNNTTNNNNNNNTISHEFDIQPQLQLNNIIPSNELSLRFSNRNNNLYEPALITPHSQKNATSQNLRYGKANNSIHLSQSPKTTYTLPAQPQLQPQFQLKLPTDIEHNLSNNDFKLYSSILDFISNESIRLEKELYTITHQKELANVLTSINESGNMMHYSQAFNEERIKSIYLEKAYKNKSNIFQLIKSHIHEVFTFIIDNPTRKDIFNSKFKLITTHIDDYYETFGKKENKLYSQANNNEQTKYNTIQGNDNNIRYSYTNYKQLPNKHNLNTINNTLTPSFHNTMYNNNRINLSNNMNNY